MTKYIILLTLVAMLVGCGTDTTYQDRKVFTSNGQVVATTQSTASEPTEAATPAWISQTIRATGQNAANPKFAHNPAQAQAMARRGAILEAKRNLLERVLGLKVRSNTLVKDMVTESDQIDAESSGLIRAAVEVGESYENGLYSATVELPLNTVYEYIKTQRTYEVD